MAPPDNADETTSVPNETRWERTKQSCVAFPWPWRGWSDLRGAPYELWIIYIIKFLSAYSYFAIMTNLTLYLSKEFGLTDSEAGWVYGIHGLMIGLVSLILGSMVDAVGVRTSLIIGLFFGLVGRIMLFAARDVALIYLALYAILPVTDALAIPVLTIGIKRYTNHKTSTVAYGLFYVVMNVAALVAFNVTTLVLDTLSCKDLSDSTKCPANTTGVRLFGSQFSAQRILIFSTIFTTACALLFAIFSFRNIDVQSDGSFKKFEQTKENFLKRIRRSVSNQYFVRLCIFMISVMIVRIIYRVLDSGFPKYFERMFHSHAWGSIIGINPLLIIFLVPIISASARHLPHIPVIIFGSSIVCASTFILMFPTIAATIAFIVILSVGEAIYSPRLYDYVMALSPSGDEGVFAALASTPMFLAKFFVGPFAGILLASFCPGHCPATLATTNSTASSSASPSDTCNNCPQPAFIWLAIGGVSFIGPISIFFLRKWFEVSTLSEDENRRKYAQLEADVKGSQSEDSLEQVSTTRSGKSKGGKGGTRVRGKGKESGGSESGSESDTPGPSDVLVTNPELNAAKATRAYGTLAEKNRQKRALQKKEKKKTRAGERETSHQSQTIELSVLKSSGGLLEDSDEDDGARGDDEKGRDSGARVEDGHSDSDDDDDDGHVVLYNEAKRPLLK